MVAAAALLCCCAAAAGGGGPPGRAGGLTAAEVSAAINVTNAWRGRPPATLRKGKALQAPPAGVTRSLLRGECPELVPLQVDGNVREVASTGRISVFFEAWCSMNPLGGLSLAECGAHKHFEVFDDGQPVSKSETQMTIAPPPGQVLSLILIDLSRSVTLSNSRSPIKTAVRAYVNRVISSTRATGPHDIAIWAFDGRKNTQPVVLWTGNDVDASSARIMQDLDSLDCGIIPSLGGQEFCADPSTNLHGALLWAAQEINRRSLEVQDADPPAYVEKFVVFFTDGTDQADRETGGVVLAEKLRASTDATWIAIGVEGEDTDGRTGVDKEELAQIVGPPPSQVFLAKDGFRDTGGEESLQRKFDLAANAVVSFASRYYRLEYCSPRRESGVHTLQVVGRIDQTRGSALEVSYNSDLFDEIPTCVEKTSAVGACAEARQELSAHACAGCSEYNCDTQRCECQSGQCDTGHCFDWAPPQDDDLRPEQNIGVARCATNIPPGPLPFASFEQWPNSKIILGFDAVCGDGSAIDGLSFSSCAELSSLAVKEQGGNNGRTGGGDAVGFVRLSEGESRARIRCVSSACEVVSLILIDTSGSIRSCHSGANLAGIRGAVTGYLDGMYTQGSKNHHHHIAVHAFDGRAGTQQVTDFSNDEATVRRAVTDFGCGGDNFCLDPATNLYGALLEAENILQGKLRELQQAGTKRYHAFLTVFTDGTDTAGRLHADRPVAQPGDVVNADLALAMMPSSFLSIASRRTVYAVGVRGDRRDASKGLFEQALRTIAPGRTVFLDPPSGGAGSLVEDWTRQGREFGDQVGAEAMAACCRSSRYELTYCSPKRGGKARVRVELEHAAGSTFWEHEFDAGAFDCESGACRDCGELIPTMSCAQQANPDQQLFICSDDQNPEAVEGTCRCPCPSGSEYPPYPGPGLVKCQCERPEIRTPIPTIPITLPPPYTPPPPTAAPTCAPGQQPLCPFLPSAPQTPNLFTATSDSHVKMEFDVFCGDGNPIPGLRFSSCPELSDFHVYESNELGEFRNVSLWESMPRVVCTPDVISLVLLDTSGSVRLGEGEQFLRESVMMFLDTVGQAIEVRHTIAVYAFDGRRGIRQITTGPQGDAFTDDIDQAKAQVNAWACGGEFCIDPSTNLNGAMVDAQDILRVKVTMMDQEADDFSSVRAHQPFLVLFTDGTDQAGWMQQEQAERSLSDARMDYRLSTYSIGLQGETAYRNRGIDEDKLRALSICGTHNCVFIAREQTEVTKEFVEVGEAIAGDVRGSASGRRYRVDYCSPKREGRRRARLALSYGGQSTWWEGEFDASLFACGGAGDSETRQCKRCLNQYSLYTCQKQPHVDQQAFTCEVGSPTVVDGVCRCPCPAGTPYPPLEGGPTPPPRPQPGDRYTPTPYGTTPKPAPPPPSGTEDITNAQVQDMEQKLQQGGYRVGLPAPSVGACSTASLGTMQQEGQGQGQGRRAIFSMLFSAASPAEVTEATLQCVIASVAAALRVHVSRVTARAEAGAARRAGALAGGTRLVFTVDLTGDESTWAQPAPGTTPAATPAPGTPGATPAPGGGATPAPATVPATPPPTVTSPETVRPTPQPTTAAPTNANSDSDDSSSDGMIAIPIAVGCLCLLAVCGVVFFMKKKNAQQPPPGGTEPMMSGQPQPATGEQPPERAQSPPYQAPGVDHVSPDPGAASPATTGSPGYGQQAYGQQAGQASPGQQQYTSGGL